MGPDPSSFRGRQMGSDFGGKDGWNMYHGKAIPGFPQHPHRGFETITLVRRGLIDHTDSSGAAARFGEGGDVQWMTAGKGIVHCEMFPLLKKDDGNPAELFQVWLNLPAKRKMVHPHFTMFWHEKIPRGVMKDEEGRETEVVVIANGMSDQMPWGEKVEGPKPPPDSWASDPEANVVIWTLKMQPGAHFKIPASAPALSRNLFHFLGGSLTLSSGPDPVTAVDSRTFPSSALGHKLRSDADVYLINGDAESELLLLQGKPISEPVAQYGPFVMNTESEIRQAFADYQRTQFGGWPFKSDEPTHERAQGRFARHSDGKIEVPGGGEAKGIARRRDEL